MGQTRDIEQTPVLGNRLGSEPREQQKRDNGDDETNSHRILLQMSE